MSYSAQITDYKFDIKGNPHKVYNMLKGQMGLPVEIDLDSNEVYVVFLFDMIKIYGNEFQYWKKLEKELNDGSFIRFLGSDGFDYRFYMGANGAVKQEVAKTIWEDYRLAK